MPENIDSDEGTVFPYELLINVKKANITGGGLPNNCYVETYIDGNIMIIIDHLLYFI